MAADDCASAVPSAKEFALVVLLTLVGCDKVVKSQLIEERKESARVQCRHPGFCMGMTRGFNGKTSFGLRHSAFCPGVQETDVSVTTYRVTLESGKEAIRSNRTVLKTTGACQ